ncbi:signal transduction histidine kinase/DNA-binding response OmpR family regulator [Robbsia andropogonis]|uniref:ATP-binding protein n=1 Tax=Robbsia andropogonis TaxID=28092 RepID=UPI003D1C9AF0
MPSSPIRAPLRPTLTQGNVRHAQRGPCQSASLPAPTPDGYGLNHGVPVDDLPAWHATDTLPLTAVIAHELRMPMQGLLGTLELLSETPLNARQQALLRIGTGAAVALERIANDVLDFTKLRTAQPSIAAEPVDLRQMIEDVAALLDAKVPHPGVVVKTHVDNTVAPWVSTDPIRLRQLLLNLVTNALKFTDAGHVLIHVSRSTSGLMPPLSKQDGSAGFDTNTPYVSPCDATSASDSESVLGHTSGMPRESGTPSAYATAPQAITIDVIDTGIGIPAQALATICRPFAQVDEHLARNPDGSGLGLAIAKLLASRLGGSLTLTSEVGVGTTARLAACWPIANAPNSRESSQPTTKNAASSTPPADGTCQSATTAAAPAPEREPMHQRRRAKTPPSVRNVNGALHGERSSALQSYRAQILVVDDHPTTRLVLDAQLGALGHGVATAENADAAVALLRQRRFDLMLTDCKMPGRDGLSLAAAWRQVEVSGALPMRVIGLTANPLPGQAMQQYAAGFDECLVKPVTSEVLSRLCVRDWHPRHPSLASHRAHMITDQASIFQDARARRPDHAQQAPLDLQRLRNIFGNAVTLDRVLTSFIAATLEDLRLIDTAFIQQQPARASQRPLHRLTGGLQVLGCSPLANHGAALEHAMTTASRRRGRRRVTPSEIAKDTLQERRLSDRLRAFSIDVVLCLDWVARQRLR